MSRCSHDVRDPLESPPARDECDDLRAAVAPLRCRQPHHELPDFQRVRGPELRDEFPSQLQRLVVTGRGGRRNHGARRSAQRGALQSSEGSATNDREFEGDPGAWRGLTAAERSQALDMLASRKQLCCHSQCAMPFSPELENRTEASLRGRAGAQPPYG